MKKTSALLTISSALIMLSSCGNDGNSIADNNPSSDVVADSSSIVIADVHKVTAYYNAAGYLIKQNAFSWSLTDRKWLFANSQRCFYNRKGSLVAKEIAMPDIFEPEKITPVELDSFAYTPQGDTSLAVKYVYSPFNQKWTKMSKTIYKYRGRKKTEETILSWDIESSQWHTVCLQNFEYNNRGELSEMRTTIPDRNDTALKHTSTISLSL